MGNWIGSSANRWPYGCGGQRERPTQPRGTDPALSAGTVRLLPRGRIDLAKAKAPDISLRGTYLAQRLSARRLRLTHNLNLAGGFCCQSRVDLRYAHIGGMNGEQATLSNPNGRALTGDGLIGGIVKTCELVPR